MKLMVMFGTFVLVFIAILGFVSAADCTDSQTIMKLYGTSNTHGAIWNDSNYANRICYNYAFTPDYTGSNPHGCNSDGSDIVLTLSSLTNAHAGPKGSYPINVCYKGLSSCTISSSGVCDASSGKTAILYLSSSSGNAHVSSTPQIGYAAVCCNGEGAVVGPTVPTSNCYELGQGSCYGNGIARGDVGCKATNKDACFCSWNNNTSKCEVGWDIVNPNDPTGSLYPGCSYKCLIGTAEQTTCSGGSKILSLGARVVGIGNCPSTTFISPACTSSSATVPCGGLDQNLPFFDGWQVVASLISIALIYVLFLSKKSI